MTEQQYQQALKNLVKILKDNDLIHLFNAINGLWKSKDQVLKTMSLKEIIPEMKKRGITIK